jgi:DNA polymerase-3 subunit delta'
MPFSTIIGHDRIVDILQRALAAKRIAHAYLFAGPEGCGKQTTALALLEAAWCNGEDGCGNCPSCRKVAARQHPDLHILEPDGAFIKIDQVRELQRGLALRPYEAPFKACIIEAADRLHPSAGNALLKTLEEPPGKALLILLTAHPDNVLPTIRSRCQPLSFPALSEDAVTALLVRGGTLPDAARLAASLSGGSPGKAVDLCSEEALINRRELLEQLFSFSLRDISSLLAASERLAAEKESLPGLIDLVLTFLRDVMHLQYGSGQIMNHDLEELALTQAGRRNPETLVTLIEQVSEIGRSLQRNVNARLATDLLLMRLAA